MEKVATIGLDIAKLVFQVHGVDADGEVLIRRRLTRARMLPFFAKLPRCLIGIEAYAERHGTKRPWLVQLLARRPAKVAAVALANKNARMVWALMTSGERYREPLALVLAA